MSRILYVGDMHVTPNSLDECGTLVNFIADTAEKEKVDYIVLLGDQFHTHSVIQMSVLGFWRVRLEQLAAVAPTYALVGNHDMTGRSDYLNAMMAYDIDDVTVVTEPTNIGKILLLSYVGDNDEFLNCVEQNVEDANVLVCHQTFDGSVYENGFYAKDGVNPNLIPCKLVISGHIHTPQQFGKLWYPGSPRWQTISDANVERAIWVVDHAEDGMILEKKAFDVSHVCKPIFSIKYQCGEKLPIIPTGATVYVDVYGSEMDVREYTEMFEKCNYHVRPFPTQDKVLKVKESDGLPESLRKFLADYQPKFGTPKERIVQLAAERISWFKGAA